MKVVFCSSEVVPFAKTGGMADVCGALPLALEHLGISPIIILPKYKSVAAAGFPLQTLSPQVSTAKIGRNIDVYFIEHPEYFERDGLYGDKGGDYPDNCERFQYFCLKALELLKTCSVQPDIVHCHDWQTGLIPAYLKSKFASDPFYKKMRSIVTIHNLAYQGVFPKKEFPKLALDDKYFSPQGFEFYDQINFLKGAINFSDKVTTVSPTYAKEIQTKEQGCGLEGVIKHRKDGVTGILNGLDYALWNPETDTFLERTFSSNSVEEGKSANKEQLRQELGLPQSAVPLFGFVGRLSYQKGLDLLFKIIDALATLNLQLVFLGVGEDKYQKMLETAAAKYPQKIKLRLDFDEQMAHRIYAASDFFLMPSLYEPCGLSQMISLRYGTVPIVHKTGGLADTIEPIDRASGRGNGLVFSEYREDQLLAAIKAAVGIFQNKDVFHQLVRQTMTYDFSWDQSAKQYVELYEQCALSV